VVLNLFNQSSTLNFNDIKAATDIEEGELKRVLQSLACGAVKVLTKGDATVSRKGRREEGGGRKERGRREEGGGREKGELQRHQGGHRHRGRRAEKSLAVLGLWCGQGPDQGRYYGMQKGEGRRERREQES
jgi:hypothetical protein